MHDRRFALLVKPLPAGVDNGSRSSQPGLVEKISRPVTQSAYGVDGLGSSDAPDSLSRPHHNRSRRLFIKDIYLVPGRLCNGAHVLDGGGGAWMQDLGGIEAIVSLHRVVTA